MTTEFGIKCEDCGATMIFDSVKNEFGCQYCGKIIPIIDVPSNSELELEKEKNREKARKDEWKSEQRKARRKEIKKWFLIMCLVVLVLQCMPIILELLSYLLALLIF